MKILYLDCSAGIAGDMTVAALIDLGVPLETIREGLGLLQLPEGSWALHAGKTSRMGIAAIHFQVEAPDQSHGRRYADIVAIIDASGLSEPVKELSHRIFRRLAQAEAKVHGVQIDQVHFHEVGAIDSLVDVVGTAIALDHLGVEEVRASALPFGSGWVETAHGRLPVPAPATAELLCGLPVIPDPVTGEWVTPTGAAIVAALAAECGAPPSMRVVAVGYGAGTRECKVRPNLLRAVLGESTNQVEQILVMETNLDDMNPEVLGFLTERLLADGALDVTLSPLQMKKNRAGSKLTVIAPRRLLENLGRLILTESTAIGLRYYPVDRLTLERHEEQCMTTLGATKVKRIRRPDGSWRTAPEFEECCRLAAASGLPLIEVYRIVERETVVKQ